MLPGRLKHLRVCAWNARGFFAKSHAKRDRKRKYLDRLAARHDVIGIMESHANEVALQRLRAEFEGRFEIYDTPPTGQWRGGAFIMVSCALAAASSHIHDPEILEDSRVISIRYDFENEHLRMTLAHNFHLARETEILANVTKYTGEARGDPSGHSICVVMGDFNFMAKGEQYQRIGDEQEGEICISNRWQHTAALQDKWYRAMGGGIELMQDEPDRLRR